MTRHAPKRETARRLLVAVPAVAAATAVAAFAAAATTGSTATAHYAAASGVRFASPTVVDEFVPGYEPDVVQDTSHGANRGTYFSSWPNGFSTTISYLSRSDDQGQSFHRTAGSVAGKPGTCIGGGDSELQFDGKDGQLLFSDLQGLTNFSNSSTSDGGNTYSTTCVAVKGAGVDRQWIAIDDNGGQSTIGTGTGTNGAGDGRAYEFYDNVAQNTSTSNPSGNSPVVNTTTDGVNYGSCVDAAATICQGPAAPISAQDDIVGNAFVDNTVGGPRQHEIYEVRGNNDSSSVLISTCRGAAAGTATTASATAGHCTGLGSTDPSATTSALQNPNWSDHVVAKLPTGYKAKSFDVGAIDSKGNVYVTWVQYKLDSSGNYASTGQVELAHSTDGGLTFSAPVQVNPPSQPTVIFPWITAGDPGRVDLVWYSNTNAKDPSTKLPGPDPANTGTWNVSFAQSLDALSTVPTFAESKVSDHAVKYGDISTGGLGGAADRSLGDFLQVKTGTNGQAIVSYVDDTSGGRNTDVTGGSGEDPPEAAGPTMSATQVAGASLFDTVPTVGSGTAAYGSVTDPVGKGFPDSYLAFAGANTGASKALDIAGVSVVQQDTATLKITLKTADPTLALDLAPSPTLGAAGALYANWRVRWAARYGTSGLDGQIYYVGLQAGPDGTPDFYVGKTSCVDSTRCKYFVYPTGTAAKGVITGSTITWTVPNSAVGSPKANDGMYSVTGFTTTSTIPDQAALAAAPTGSGQVGDLDAPLANLIDASGSFSYVLGHPAPGSPAVPQAPGAGSGSAGGAGSSGGSGGELAFTGLGAGVPLAALVLVGTGYALRRRSRR